MLIATLVQLTAQDCMFKLQRHAKLARTALIKLLNSFVRCKQVVCRNPQGLPFWFFGLRFLTYVPQSWIIFEMQRVARVIRLPGLTPFQRALDLQHRLFMERVRNERLKLTGEIPQDSPDLDDVVILVQHPLCYTLGRGSSERHLRFDPQREESIELHRIERGGEVTCHLPGQLVAYPIMNLNHHKRDLHSYCRQVEQSVIDTLERFDIRSERIPGLTGVWVTQQVESVSVRQSHRKISAIGVNCSRWITMHGTSVNVNCDINAFDRIVACGIEDQDKSVTSIEAEYQLRRLDRQVPTVEQVSGEWLQSFQKVFGVKLVDEQPPKDD